MWFNLVCKEAGVRMCLSYNSNQAENFNSMTIFMTVIINNESVQSHPYTAYKQEINI